MCYDYINIQHISIFLYIHGLQLLEATYGFQRGELYVPSPNFKEDGSSRKPLKPLDRRGVNPEVF